MKCFAGQKVPHFLEDFTLLQPLFGGEAAQERLQFLRRVCGEDLEAALTSEDVAHARKDAAGCGKDRQKVLSRPPPRKTAVVFVWFTLVLLLSPQYKSGTTKSIALRRFSSD